jgi:peptidoglycan/xylan/chitin deacetylase (PgdA/CDA1 family)
VAGICAIDSETATVVHHGCIVLKSAAATAFHYAGGLAAMRWRNRGGLRILMYHRFSDRSALGRQCAHLRRHYHPVSMAAVSEWLHSGRRLPPNALAVTVDDGYGDFEEAGFPVFADYAIPITVYLATDFLDGKSWLWFDRVIYAFRHAMRSDVSIEMPSGNVLYFKLESDAGRRASGQHLADLAVALSPADRGELISRLPRLLQVEMPEEPPLEYRPLRWDAVRAMAASGVEFGAHTKTHPILSALTNPEELREEIAGSKARVESELGGPVLHFCYPNGKMRDIGPNAAYAVRAAGMQTAVTAEPGLNQLYHDAYLLNRIGADPTDEEKYFARSVARARG